MLKFYRIADMNTDEKMIFSFLKENNLDLADRFRSVLSMARDRKQVLNKISNISDTLFQHIILYVLFERNSIPVPNSWNREILGYLKSINALNSCKKKKWLTADQIMSKLNDLLEFETKDLVEDKLDSFDTTIREKIQPSLNEFFKAPKIEKLAIIKYNNENKLIFEVVSVNK